VAKVTGDTACFELLFSALHRFTGGLEGDFNIIEP
jgi:hypothetical protein